VHEPASLRFRLSRSALAFAVGAATLVASVGLGAVPASAASNRVALSGTVTSGSTHKPLHDVTITVLPAFDPVAEYQEPVAEGYTEADGSYDLTVPEPGDYRVLFEDLDDEYEPSNGGYLAQFTGGVPGDIDDDFAPTVALSGGSVILDQELTLGGIVNGTVVSASGTPVKGMQLYAADLTKTDFFYDGPQRNAWTRTDSKGRYTLRGLPFVDTAIITQPESTYATSTTSIGVLSTSQPRLALGPIVAPLDGEFRGVVTDSSGKPQPYAEISYDSVYAQADKNGRFRVTGLPVGIFTPEVTVDSSTTYRREYLGGSQDPFLAKTITIGKPGTVVTRDFRLAKLATLKGVVRTATGERARNVEVNADQNDTVNAGYDSFGSYGADVTNSKGEYSISALGAGSYNAWFGSRPTSAGAPVVKGLYLSAGTRVLNATLSPVTAVKGTVSSPSGSPLSGITVQAVPANGSESCLGDGPNPPYVATRTSSKGTYSLALPAGKWVIRFTDPEGDVGSRFLGGGTYLSDPLTTVVDTAAGPKSGRNITLPRTGVTITALARSAGGSELVQGSSSLYRLINGEYVDGPHWGECYYSEFGHSLNDAFPMTRLVDGDYELDLSPQTYLSHWDTPGKTISFTIAGGKLTTVDGEPATSSSSLGTIVLPEPVYIENPGAPTIPQPLIEAADGVRVGKTLHANTGVQLPEDAWRTFQWLRDGRPIEGATSEEYVIQPGDAGAVLTYVFSGYTGTDYIDAIESEPSGIVEAGELTAPGNAPVVTGSGTVGAALTVASPTDAAAGSTFTYQWFINNSVIGGATSKTFTPRIRDLDETLRVEVTTHTPGASEATTLSSASVTVLPGIAPKLSTPRVLANGKATTGSKKKSAHYGTVLTATAPSKPLEALVISYQWQVNRGGAWTDLAGATTRSLTLPKKKTANAALGYRYRLVANAERSGYEAITPVASHSVTLTK